MLECEASAISLTGLMLQCLIFLGAWVIILLYFLNIHQGSNAAQQPSTKNPQVVYIAKNHYHFTSKRLELAVRSKSKLQIFFCSKQNLESSFRHVLAHTDSYKSSTSEKKKKQLWKVFNIC